MGAYSSKPNTDTLIDQGSNEYLTFGASSMQGWRVTQEDAHVAILDFDQSPNNCSFFAVFDGHGGSEVAEYASKHLPSWIKQQEEYKKGNIEEALKKGFLSFDKTLTDDRVMAELRKLANIEDRNHDEEAAEAALLREEANMALEDVMSQYALKSESSKDEKNASNSKKSDQPGPSSSSSHASSSSSFPIKVEILNSTDAKPTAGSSSSTSSSSPNSNSVHNSSETVNNSTPTTVTNGTKTCDENLPGSSVKDNSTDSVNSKNENSSIQVESATVDPELASNSALKSTPEFASSSTSNNSSSSPAYKGKGKHKKPIVIRPKRSKTVDSKTAYEQFLEDFGGDEDEDDDETDDSEDDPLARAFDDDSDDDDASDDEEDDDDDDDEEDSSEEEDESFANEEATSAMEDPGQDSGCTAVVAIVIGDKLYVANAGDSRCVVSSNGTAIDMSVDHKPEDEIELNRINKAGGQVTLDGRVNGGLNLSRALGDHVYKARADLPLEEQMISSLPDVKVINLDSSTDFMVLACDGIWNSMSSQQVIDFVGERLKKDVKPSDICVELFNACLAHDTMGDGTGCDNMTAIIVKFCNISSQERKRKASEADCVTDAETVEKKAKTENDN